MLSVGVRIPDRDDDDDNNDESIEYCVCGIVSVSTSEPRCRNCSICCVITGKNLYLTSFSTVDEYVPSTPRTSRGSEVVQDPPNMSVNVGVYTVSSW